MLEAPSSRRTICPDKLGSVHSSMIDSDQLSKGRKYSEVPETYVIFITESDVMKKGDSVYFIERCIMNTGELFGDESHIVYVNGACRDDSPIGRLMHDFSCRNADEMHYKVLRDRVKFFKESKEGRDMMSKAMEDFGRLYEKRGEINIAFRCEIQVYGRGDRRHLRTGS